MKNRKGKKPVGFHSCCSAKSFWQTRCVGEFFFSSPAGRLVGNTFLIFLDVIRLFWKWWYETLPTSAFDLIKLCDELEQTNKRTKQIWVIKCRTSKFQIRWRNTNAYAIYASLHQCCSQSLSQNSKGQIDFGVLSQSHSLNNTYRKHGECALNVHQINKFTMDIWIMKCLSKSWLGSCFINWFIH